MCDCVHFRLALKQAVQPRLDTGVDVNITVFIFTLDTLQISFMTLRVKLKYRPGETLRVKNKQLSKIKYRKLKNKKITDFYSLYFHFLIFKTHTLLISLPPPSPLPPLHSSLKAFGPHQKGFHVEPV